MTDTRSLAVAERRDLLAFLRELEPADWERPTLCEHWSVREVVAHVYSYDERSLPGLAGLCVRGAMRPARINDVAMREHEESPPEELLALAERCLEPRGLPAALGAGVALTDGLIHHQDLRRPLGRPRAVPGERVRVALGVALRAPTLPARAHARGLRLEASDLDWSRGGGALVRGPAEALLMAVAGRADALPELEGDGVALLADRLG